MRLCKTCQSKNGFGWLKDDYCEKCNLLALSQHQKKEIDFDSCVKNLAKNRLTNKKFYLQCLTIAKDYGEEFDSEDIPEWCDRHHAVVHIDKEINRLKKTLSLITENHKDYKYMNHNLAIYNFIKKSTKIAISIAAGHLESVQ